MKDELIAVGDGALGVPVFKLLRDRLGKRQAERVDRAFQVFVEQVAVVAEFGDDLDHVAEVAKLIDNAAAHTVDVLLEWFRTMMEVLDPATLPYVARLAAEYTWNKKARDSFFRRVGNLLTEINAVELSQLITLLDHVATCLDRHGEIVDKNGTPCGGVSIEQRGTSDLIVRLDTPPARPHEAERLALDGEDVINALRRARLGAESNIDGGSNINVRFSRDRAHDLYRLLELFVPHHPRSP